MSVSRLVRGIVVGLVVGTSVVAVVGCGDGKDAKHAKIVAGPMPEGEDWSGVYYHPIYGNLHLQEEGSNIVGAWARTDQSRFGELSGTHQGNVFHFTWSEKDPSFPGPSGTKKGKGYFVYKMDDENRPVLKGQFGLGDEEVGSDWSCVKQKNQKPDVKSIRKNTETTHGNGF